jgi:hypothetical protein
VRRGGGERVEVEIRQERVMKKKRKGEEEIEVREEKRREK